MVTEHNDSARHASTRVTHRYQFYASHRLHSPALTDAENADTYGKCNNPYGHGHNYVLQVSIAGNPDPVTGLIVNRGDVDALVQAKVLQLFDYRNINKDVPEFQTLVPTTENVAIVIAEFLERAWNEAYPHGGPRIVRVHVQETDRNGFEVLLGNRDSRGRQGAESDSAGQESKERVFA
jgi:6-pyruvoyltetrahydropterin/6-carboxytetrahydropterin synthase